MGTPKPARRLSGSGNRSYVQLYIRLQAAVGGLLVVLDALPGPLADRVVTAALALVCLTVAFICWRRGTLPSPALIWSAVAVVVIASLAEAAMPSHAEVPWVAAVATGLVTVAVAAGSLSRGQTAAATIAMTAGWAAHVSSQPTTPGAAHLLLCTALAVALACSVTSVRTHLSVRAEAASRATSIAVTQARRDELRRQQLLLHDHASLLAVLSTPGLSPELEEAAKHQAAQAAHTVRAFLTADGDDPEPVGDAPMTLEQIVRSVAADFRDLPLELVLGLATERTIAADQARAVRAALATVLHNVRRHAHADHVVVHADHPAGSQAWEVYVRDDGIGFDVTTTRWGFGLREQAAAELERVGLNLSVWSEPSDGTRVVIAAPGRPV